MFSNSFSFVFIFGYFLVLNKYIVSCEEVPSVFWNIKGNAFHLRPSSALTNNDEEFISNLKEITDANANILVFALNKLSLEDFSASEKSRRSNLTLQNLQMFLDTQRYMFLSSVHDPLNKIHKVHCGVQEIIVDHNIDDSILPKISEAFKSSCVVVLHIMDSGDSNVEDLKSIFLPALPEDSKDVVAVFTGKKSSWEGVSENNLYMRNLLATVEEDEGSYVNISGCLLMYAENASIWYKEDNKTISLPFPVDSEGSKCGNQSALLQLNFKPSEGGDVVIRFNFTRDLNSWVTTVNLETATIQDRLVSDNTEAPVGFSFTCGDYIIRNFNRTVKLTIEGFQVQPFAADNFSESFDCVTWFTIPIWMGVIVAILFIIIVNFGVYALFTIHTMDRFDDPKGKTISVAAGVE